MSRLGGDAVQPCADRRVVRQIVAALVRHMRVGVEGDVGDRAAVDDEPVAPRECALPHAEGRNAAGALGVELGGIRKEDCRGGKEGLSTSGTRVWAGDDKKKTTQVPTITQR